MKHGSLSANADEQAAAPSSAATLRGADKEAKPIRSGSASLIALGLTLALLCACVYQLRQAGQRARAAAVESELSAEPKKVYLQRASGEETVLRRVQQVGPRRWHGRLLPLRHAPEGAPRGRPPSALGAGLPPQHALR
jgi:hypothetical protein